MTLLERDAELDLLHDRLTRAISGVGRFVLVSGEAGIGKTALVRELGASLPAGTRMLTGACDPISTPAALGPLLDLGDALGPDVATLLFDHGNQLRLFAAVANALREMPGTVLVFEDIHWADDATIDLLRYLGRRIEALPVLIIATARNDEHAANGLLRPFLGELVRTPGCERIALTPLSEAAVVSLIGDRDIEAGMLLRRSGGNPFYLTQLLESGSSLPPTISDAVLGRWARLSTETRPVVQVAAVLGPGVSVELIGAVSDAPAAGPIDEAIGAGLMSASEHGVGFRHELAREAILESITPLRLQELNRTILRVAPGIVPGADPAWMAHYATSAGDDAAILRYSSRAADQALALGANRQAAHHFQHALAAAADEPDEVRIPLLEGFATAATALGWAVDDLRVRRELVELHRGRGDHAGEIEQLLAITTASTNNGDYRGADLAIKQVIALLDGVPEGQLHPQVYATRAMLFMLDRRADEAIAYGYRAIELADRFDDRVSAIRARNAIGSAMVVSGRVPEGAAVLEEGIALAEALGRPAAVVNLRGNLGSGSGEVFELAVAETALTRAIEEARAADLDGPLSYARSWLALVRLYQGRWDESARIARETLAMANANAISRMTSLLALGRVRARRGDPDVWEALDAALALAEPTGTLQRIAPVAAARAEARWLGGDAAGTVMEAERGYELAIRHQHPWLAGELAYWLRQGGVDTTPDFPVAAPWQAQLVGDQTGAAAAWADRGCPYESARACLPSSDETELGAALRTFEQLGAAPMAVQTAHRLRELGATSLPRGPRKTTRENAAGLTTRELEVLQLLEDGSTYTEIGSALYVSNRTIEHHVSSILRKLGARSRRDAVHLAIERGIISG